MPGILLSGQRAVLSFLSDPLHFIPRAYRSAKDGWYARTNGPSSPRNAISNKTSNFVIEGWGALSIAIAVVTFCYFFVQYNLVPQYLIPAVLMFLLLETGIVLSAILVKFQVRLRSWDIIFVVLATLATVIIFGADVLLNYLGGVFAPAAGAVPTVVMSPAAYVLFYFSAGVSEASFFVLFLFRLFLAMFNDLGGAIILSSIAFMFYHLGVIMFNIYLYGGSFYSSIPYMILIFVANVTWTIFFYYTRHFAVVAWSHGLFNAAVVILGLLGLITITL